MTTDLVNKLNLKYSDSLLIFGENRSSDLTRDIIELEFNDQNIKLLNSTKFDKIVIQYNQDYGSIYDVLKTILSLCDIKSLALVSEITAVDTNRSNGHAKSSKDSISEFISTNERMINVWYLDETEDKFDLLIEVVR